MKIDCFLKNLYPLCQIGINRYKLNFSDKCHTVRSEKSSEMQFQLDFFISVYKPDLQCFNCFMKIYSYFQAPGYPGGMAADPLYGYFAAVAGQVK